MAASPAIGNNSESTSKFLETLQSDLKVLASETKKKYPQIREVRKMRYADVTLLGPNARLNLSMRRDRRVGKFKKVSSFFLVSFRFIVHSSVLNIR